MGIVSTMIGKGVLPTLECKTFRSVKASQTAHLRPHQQERDAKLASLMLEPLTIHALSSDVLRWQTISIYRESIDRMRPAEITLAHADSQNEPVWQESLEIFGASRLRQLIKSGEISAVEAALQLDRQIQEKQGNTSR